MLNPNSPLFYFYFYFLLTWYIVLKCLLLDHITQNEFPVAKIDYILRKYFSCLQEGTSWRAWYYTSKGCIWTAICFPRRMVGQWNCNFSFPLDFPSCLRSVVINSLHKVGPLLLEVCFSFLHHSYWNMYFQRIVNFNFLLPSWLLLMVRLMYL